MMRRILLGSMLVAVSVFDLAGNQSALAAGADVIVGDLTGPFTWTSGGPTSGMVRYSWGTTSCNIGNVPLHWYDFGTGTPTEHPVISQNLFRLKNGQFDHIGQAWLKHGFCALQGGICGACTPYCGGCCDELGVGCSDPYSSSRNGDPNGVGPKSQINPAAGLIMVWPYSKPSSLNPGGNNCGQLQVPVADIAPAQNVGALYFAEGQYIAHDDALAGNDNNNASYRRVAFANSAGFPATYQGATFREKPGIQAWKDTDPGVTLVVNDSADGRFILGYKVTDLGGGNWHYEYAIQNVNSDRGGQTFKIPVPDCVTVDGQGFHDVDYHSGDGVTIGTNYDGADWTITRSGGMVTWSMVPAALASNSNALRWATMYTFRFDCKKPPQAATASMDLFKAGIPTSLNFAIQGPSGNSAPSCPADANQTGAVDIDDLVVVITNWAGTGPLGDVNPPCGNGAVNIDDLVTVITGWGQCPR